MSCHSLYTVNAEDTDLQTAADQDLYQSSPSAQLGRGSCRLVDVSFPLNWALLQIRKCRTRIQVFQVSCLSSCSAVFKYISNFLRVTGMSPQPTNAAIVLISLSMQRDRNSRGSSWQFFLLEAEKAQRVRRAQECTRAICRYSRPCPSKQHEKQPSLIFSKEQTGWGLHREMQNTEGYNGNDDIFDPRSNRREKEWATDKTAAGRRERGESRGPRETNRKNTFFVLEL